MSAEVELPAGLFKAGKCAVTIGLCFGEWFARGGLPLIQCCSSLTGICQPVVRSNSSSGEAAAKIGCSGDSSVTPLLVRRSQLEP